MFTSWEKTRRDSLIGFVSEYLRFPLLFASFEARAFLYPLNCCLHALSIWGAICSYACAGRGVLVELDGKHWIGNGAVLVPTSTIIWLAKRSNTAVDCFETACRQLTLHVGYLGAQTDSL